MPFDGNARWQLDILAADKTAAAFGSVDRRLKTLEVGVAGMGRTMAVGVGQTMAFGRALGQAAVAYGVISAGQKAFNAGLAVGDLGEQAEQLRLTTDQLQAYRLMAAQAGVSNEQLDASVMKLARSIGEAGEGNDEMIARFEKLGVKLLDAKGQLRGPAEVLPELSRGLLKVASDSERATLQAAFFGRSGGRVTTMLEAWAQGNERLVASARGQKAIAGPEAIKAWDDLGDGMKVAEQRYTTLVGELGKPVAVLGLRIINQQLSMVQFALDGIDKGWKAATGLFETSSETLVVRQATLSAMVENLKDSTDALDVAKVAGMRKELEAISGTLAGRAKVVTVPEIVVTASKPGVSQPTGTKAGAAGQKLDDRLRELQAERTALEKALAAFQVRGLETVDAIDRKLDAQVKLDKKVFDVLKDVPPNSPLALALVQEATAVSQLNTKLDERKRLLSEGEEITARFGDGSAAAAREIARLNEMLAAGAIGQATYSRAVKATSESAAEQERVFRGATGGWQGFIAGIEQGMAEQSRSNSLFEVGKRGVQMFSQEIANAATGAEVDFGRIALSFANMLIQMEMAAAASNIFNMLTGKGATDQGLGGMFASWLGGLGGGGGEAGLGLSGGEFTGIAFAGGGDTPVGMPYLVGENGPEVRVDGQPGHIYNRSQWSEMMRGGGSAGGGRIDIYVHENGELLRLEIDNRSQANIMRAAPGIVGAAVDKAGEQVMPRVNRHHAEAGGDWRLG